jgi:hypothetical protein
LGASWGIAVFIRADIPGVLSEPNQQWVEIYDRAVVDPGRRPGLTAMKGW